MIKAPLNLLSEKLNRLNFFISHDEVGGFWAFHHSCLSLQPARCLFGNTDSTGTESIPELTRAAVLTQLS